LTSEGVFAKAEQIACGIWPLIEDGFRRCEREHGRKPVALVLHPAHAHEFCAGTESDDAILDGVAVIQDFRVIGQSLVDKHGYTFEI